MRITHFLTWADDSGGTSRAVLTQAKFLASCGHDVRVLSAVRTRETPFNRIDPRIKVEYLVDNTTDPPSPGRGADYGGEARLHQLSAADSHLVLPEDEPTFSRLSDLEAEYVLRHLDTDILVTTNPPLLAIAARFAPNDVIVVHQEHRASEVRIAQLDALLTNAPRADAVVVLTSRTREWLLEMLGEAAPRIEVVPGGIDDDVLRPRSALDGKVIVAAGLLQRRKQFGHLIRAFASLTNRHPEWSLRIFGEGPQRQPLARLISDLDMTDRARLMGLAPDMAREWAKASIGALVSKDEAFPLVILEAFAAGVPFVSYDTPTGPAEIIAHERDGLIVPLDSKEGLTAALDRLMSNDDERRAMGEAAYRASAQFGARTAFRHLEDLYQDLLVRRDAGDRLDAALRRIGADATIGRAAYVEQDSDSLQAAVSARASRAKHPDLDRTRAAAAADAASQAVEAVRSRNPDLVLQGGRLWHPVQAVTPVEARQRNLADVVQALEASGIKYVLVRDQLGDRIGVEEDDRARVFDAIVGAYQHEAVYVAPVSRGQEMARPSLVAEIPSRLEITGSRIIGIGRFFASPQNTLRLAAAYGCEVEFWPRKDGVLHMPAPPTLDPEPLPDEPITEDALEPVRVEIGGRAYTSAKAFVARRVEEVDFPIDAVYTWVDGADPAWQQRRAAVLASLPESEHHDEATSASRFRDHDELRYSLRSLVMHAPWINQVFIVTDQQTPAWLKLDDPRVTLIDHKQIFSDGNCLPTFNSHAIETQLHHIEGLSEHYLYINDDMFFGRYVSPELFFHGNGMAKIFPSPVLVPYGEPFPGEPPHVSAHKNSRQLIQRVFGRQLRSMFLHTPYAHLRTVLEEIERAFPEDLARTAGSRFRHHNDIALASHLYHYYAYLTKRAAPDTIRYKYVDVSRANVGPLTKLLRSRSYDVFCANDSDSDQVTPEQREEIMHNFLQSYFPFPSQFELDVQGEVVRLPRLNGT